MILYNIILFNTTLLCCANSTEKKEGKRGINKQTQQQKFSFAGTRIALRETDTFVFCHCYHGQRDLPVPELQFRKSCCTELWRKSVSQVKNPVIVEMNGWWHCGDLWQGMGALGLLLQGWEVWVGLGGWHCWCQHWEGWAGLAAGQDPGACVPPGMLPWDRAFPSTAVSVWAQGNTRGGMAEAAGSGTALQLHLSCLCSEQSLTLSWASEIWYFVFGHKFSTSPLSSIKESYHALNLGQPPFPKSCVSGLL